MEPMIRIGVEVKSGRPVEVPISIFERHCWIMGTTGGTKSVQATSIVTQIMAADRDACVLIVDFAGGQYPFHRVQETANQTRRRFRFISTSPDDDWHSIDPMEAITPLTDANVAKAASYFVSSLSLDHGGGYGKSFYGLQNYRAFLSVFLDFVAEGNGTPTLQDVVKRLAKTARKLRSTDLTESQLAAEALLPYAQLQPSQSPDSQIGVMRAVEEGECIYAFLPVLLEPAARMIGAMLIWSFVLEAMRRVAAGLPRRRTYICVDEFAAVAAVKAFADLVALARKYGIALILINQDGSQLVSRDRDLRPTLYTNTALKLWLSPIGDEFEYLATLSPDVLKQHGSTTSFRSFSSSKSFRDVYEPDLERNDGLAVAFERFEGYAVMNDFNGFRPPIRYRFIPDVSKERHDELANTPLPKRDHARHGAAHASVNATPPPRRDPEYARRQSKLDALFQRKVAQETWQTPPSTSGPGALSP